MPKTASTPRLTPRKAGRWLHRAAVAAFAVVLLASSPLFGVVSADYVQDRRSLTGVRLFRSLLTADLNITERTSPEGELVVVFYYSKSLTSAQKLAESLGAEKIRDLPVRVEFQSASQFAASKIRPAAVFLTEAPDEESLKKIIAYGIQNQVIVYSPFEGHVESGVFAGLSVEAQVRPYINQTTMQKSKISLKPFFLKVTKVYP